MFSIRVKTVVFIFLIYYAHSVRASDGESTLLVSEDEFFADVPTVDTVTRLPQRRSITPAAVTVIDSDVIHTSGARDLAELFRLVPGFHVGYIRSHRQAVTYHGLGDTFSRRLQILIDGRSVYGALFGNVSWSTLGIALEDIERIEVVRGPNTVTYGGNAFLGAINIITMHSAQAHGVEYKVAVGNNDIRDTVVKVGAHFNSGDFRLTGGYKADDGLAGLPDDSQTKYINMRGDLVLSGKDTLLLQAGISNAELGEGDYGDVTSPPSESDVDAYFTQIRWQRQLQAGHQLSLQFYHNYRDFSYDYVTDPIELGQPFGSIQIPASFSETTERHDLEFQHSFSLYTDWRFVWGIGYRTDRVKSQAFFSSDMPVEMQSSRVFVNAEWEVTPRNIINAGIMWEKNDLTGADVSPRLALNHQLSENHVLRVIGSKAIRTPSLFEEMSDLRFYFQGVLMEHQYFSSGGLRPENMTSYEFGYFGSFPAMHITLDMRLYRDRIDRFITEEYVQVADLLDNRAYSFRNEGNVVVDGMDMELNYRPNRDTKVTMTVAKMRASGSEVLSNSPRNQIQRLDSVPDYSAAILLMHRFAESWQGSIGYYLVDDMLWLSDGDSISDYDRLDLRIARQLRMGRAHGELALVAQNIGDPYEEFDTGQYFKRRYFMTFSVRF